MFSISVFSLWAYHIYLVLHNRSTLGNDISYCNDEKNFTFVFVLSEAYRAPIFRSGPDKDGFNLGKYNNFIEVFGDRKALWFMPVFTRLFKKFSLAFNLYSDLMVAQLNGDFSTSLSLLSSLNFYQMYTVCSIRIQHLLQVSD